MIDQVYSTWINSSWSTPEYQEEKKKNFEIITAYLKFSPNKLLDIGCGLAWESRMFGNQFNTELWLIDGDASNNKNKNSNSKETKYHESANSFLFYHTLELLDAELKKLNTPDYHLIDCNILNIPDDIKFDLITSWLSCGFHYPVLTYRELILKHLHKDTQIIVDLRTSGKGKDPILESGVEIVSILARYKKHVTAEIRII
jgi:SAM-dependent methyltransferase